MAGKELAQRVDELLELVGLTEAATRIARGYSGGMKRRLDIAHRPRAPAHACCSSTSRRPVSTPRRARRCGWRSSGSPEEASLTILLTTHYLEEADQLAERVAIVSRGKVVARARPPRSSPTCAASSSPIDLANPDGNTEAALAVDARHRGSVELAAEGRQLRARVPNGAEAIPVILAALDEQGFAVASVSTQRPSLDDVYLHYTGRDFATEDQEANR